MTDTPPKTRRRWLRFSLRALFVLLTLFTVGFGWVVHEVKRQSVAVAALTKAGCRFSVRPSEDPPTMLEQLRKMFGEEDWMNVQGATFGESFLSEPIPPFSQASDADLIHLQELIELEELDLYRTQVTDAGLVHLKEMTRLLTLDLSRTRVTDAGLVHLRGLSRLSRLFLEGTKVTAAGVQELEKALPECLISWDDPSIQSPAEPTMN